MKILFVVPYVPNLVRTRPYNLIRSLAERGHEITLATLTSGSKDVESARKLSAFCKEVKAFTLPKWRSYANCLFALPTRTPLQAVYCWQPKLADHLRSRVLVGLQEKRWDVIHVEHLRGVRYALMCQNIIHASSLKIPVIWDSVDCISLLFRQASVKSRGMVSRVWTQSELSRTEKYEAWLLSQISDVLVTSRSDRQAFQSLSSPSSKSATIHVLSNGVDLDYFHPQAPEEREPATLVVSGKMSYHANVAMVSNLVRKIMPLVWDKRPDVKIWVVGKDPPKEVLALSRNPSVIVTGTVADIRPYLQRATIAVTPLVYGAGVQNKVLEAMACAVPVVTSPQAVTALDVISGRDLFIEDSPAAFAARIVDLLPQAELRGQLGRAGRAYVEQYHRWSTIVQQLEGIYSRLSLKGVS